MRKYINSKSRLAIELSKLSVFHSPDTKLEQYPTDSEIAAEVLWDAYMSGDIEGKSIADFGCGTGILGIGALLLGAKEATFVDKDKRVLTLLKDNLASLGLSGRIVEDDVQKVQLDADMVLQNPPFGTREVHADKEFLISAFRCAGIVYSFHKSITRDFIQSTAEANGYRVERRWDFLFPLKQTMPHHTKRIRRIEVSCFKLVRT